MKKIIVCMICFLCGELEAKKQYNGYLTLQIRAESVDQKYVVDRLHNIPSLSFWHYNSDGVSDIMMERRYFPKIRMILEHAGMEYRVMQEDIGRVIENQEKARQTHLLGRTQSRMDWEEYYPLEKIEEFLDDLATSRSWVSKSIIAKTLEGRNVQLIHFNPGGSTERIWIDGGIHAREWITHATITYLLNQLINNYEENQGLADRFDWYFVPVINPDGYVYTWLQDRMWRKNRNPNLGRGICYGVDLNRNYASKFHHEENTCSETYPGTHPFSEEETSGIRDTVLRYAPFQLMLNVHSYSQLVLYPWGFTGSDTNDAEAQRLLATAAAQAIKHTSGMRYRIGPTARTLYYAYGTQTDWFYMINATRFPFVFELRDTGDHGFLLPASQIESTAKEFFAAMTAMMDTMAKLKADGYGRKLRQWRTSLYGPPGVYSP